MRFARTVVTITFAAACAAGAALAADEPATPIVQPGAELREVYADDLFFEGPAWDPVSQKLFFTAWGKDNQQILRLDAPGTATVWLDKTEGINGTFLASDGRVLGAQVYAHRVAAFDPAAGPAPPLQSLAHDPGWNQPNDVCQVPGGGIYFTDPNFGKREASSVYYLPPGAAKANAIITTMPLPNGIIASNDGKTLYVGDSHEKLWRAFSIRADGTVGPGRVFFDPEIENRSDPDGMTIDEFGNLYFTGRGGVWVVSPEGEPLRLIPVKSFCSNVTFGGKDGRTLFLTCRGAVYSLAMRVRGGQLARVPDAR